MKKWLIPILSLGLLTGCAEELNTENKQLVSEEQLQALVNNPESLLIYTNSVEDGTNAFLRSFSTYGRGSHDDYGLKSIDLGLDLMSNDMPMLVNQWASGYYRYVGRIANSRITGMVWSFYYKIIRDANLILVTLPPDVQDQQLRYSRGRVLVLRGMAYFNLIRIYGNGEQGIPLRTVEVSEDGRVPTSTIMAQVKADLEEAYNLLGGFQRANKTQINQNVAAGLLARFYLETGDYAQAAQMAREARAGLSTDTRATLTDGFDEISNPTWIWGADITSETTSIYASFFSQIGSLNPGYAGLLGHYKSLDRRIYDKLALFPDDLRYQEWFAAPGNGQFPAYVNTKFIDDTFFEGDYVYMRTAEMQLIEAEALALAGNNSAAQAVLSEFMAPRSASYTPASNSTVGGLLEMIRLQRAVELWGEGFAFYDMKRWGKGLDRNYEGSNHPNFGKVGPFPAGSNKFIFQIPLDELNSNNAISDADQNPE